MAKQRLSVKRTPDSTSHFVRHSTEDKSRVITMCGQMIAHIHSVVDLTDKVDCSKCSKYSNSKEYQ